MRSTRRDSAASKDAVGPPATAKDPKRRLDPRADRSRTTALEVARAILVEEGWNALTHSRVAERSGLNRVTIYRHWPTPLALLQDVFAKEPTLAQIPPTGDLRRDLLASLTTIHNELEARDLGRVLCAVIDRGEWDPEILQIKMAIVQDGLAPIAGTLEDAVRRGDLPSDLDPTTGVAQLLGPLLYRRLLSNEAITPAFIETVIDRFLAGYAT